MICINSDPFTLYGIKKNDSQSVIIIPIFTKTKRCFNRDVFEKHNTLGLRHSELQAQDQKVNNAVVFLLLIFELLVCHFVTKESQC